MSGRNALIGVVACALLAACSTEPATDVTTTTATLNGKGITGEKAVTYWFQYADAGTLFDGDAGVLETPYRGPAAPDTPLTAFSEPIVGLEPDSEYRYRACGRPVGDPVVTCVGAQTFVTAAAPATDGRIRVTGSESLPDVYDPNDAFTFTDLNIDVATTGSPATVKWSLAIRGYPVIRRTDDPVTCAVIAGHHAIVNTLVEGSPDPDQSYTFFLRDNGGDGTDTIALASNRRRGDCSRQTTQDNTRTPGTAVLDQGRVDIDPEAPAG